MICLWNNLQKVGCILYISDKVLYSFFFFISVQHLSFPFHRNMLEIYKFVDKKYISHLYRLSMNSTCQFFKSEFYGVINKYEKKGLDVGVGNSYKQGVHTKLLCFFFLKIRLNFIYIFQ